MLRCNYDSLLRIPVSRWQREMREAAEQFSRPYEDRRMTYRLGVCRVLGRRFGWEVSAQVSETVGRHLKTIGPFWFKFPMDALHDDLERSLFCSLLALMTPTEVYEMLGGEI